jgi:hypothetical protein
MKAFTLPVIAALVALALVLVPGSGGGVAMAQQPDACGNDVLDVPDSGATFNFTAACEQHDACYAAGGTEADRNACDQAFRAAMQQSCSEMWPSQPLRLRICNGVANTYYLGVHLFGWLFFPYSTSTP